MCQMLSEMCAWEVAITYRSCAPGKYQELTTHPSHLYHMLTSQFILPYIYTLRHFV